MTVTVMMTQTISENHQMEFDFMEAQKSPRQLEFEANRLTEVQNELQEVRKKLQDVSKRLYDAETVLNYYSNVTNYTHETKSVYGRVTIQNNLKDDFDRASNNDSTFVAGKRARSYFKRYENDLPCS